MFERFTKPARAAVTAAHDEATGLGSERIAAEHLLIAVAAGPSGAAHEALAGLGLTADALRADARATSGLDPDALAAIGIDLEAVRSRVEDSFGKGALDRGRGVRQRPFSPAAKKALELSLREALARGDRHIGQEHLLLGLVRDPGDGIGPLLRRRGRTADEVRAALAAALRDAA